MVYPLINALTLSSTFTSSKDYHNDHEGVNEDFLSEQAAVKISKHYHIPTNKSQELSNYSALAPTG